MQVFSLLFLSHPTPAPLCLLALLLLAQLARAVADAAAHGSPRLVAWFPRWAGADSWRLKYKQGDPALGPAFPGATTVLVAFTDCWHFANLVMWLGWAGAVLVAGVWAVPVGWLALGLVGAKVAFEPAYSWLRKSTTTN